MISLHVITIHPEFVRAYGAFGVMRAATEKGLAEVRSHGLRDFAVDKHGTVDGPPYGGGDGMVLRPDALTAALENIRGNTDIEDGSKPRVIVPSPAGRPFTQAVANRLAASPDPLIFVCGRFGGIDQRFLDKYVDEELSVGDYVVSGGELPVLVMIDAILRQIPGVLGHADSATCDSFGPAWGGGLEHPLYTRPAVFEGVAVPEVLLSGDHARIEAWKKEQAERLTQDRRPDLAPV